MSHHPEYRRLMEQIRLAHQAFKTSWTDARGTALERLAPAGRTASWEQVGQANRIAYQAAQSLADRRNRLLRELFAEHLGPLRDGLLAGEPDAINSIIDFLEVDVAAFRCGYAKQDYLRRLKTIPLTDQHQARLRQYGLRLCATPAHRREIREAARLMIRVADQDFVNQLRALTTGSNESVRRKVTKVLSVVLNGRKDLR
jgi:hypothetical protein